MTISASPLFRLPCGVLCTRQVSLAVTWKCYHTVYNVYSIIMFGHELLHTCVGGFNISYYSTLYYRYHLLSFTSHSVL